MLVQCWPAVYDVVPALNQHWVSVSCLLGSHDTVFVICDPYHYHSPPSEMQKKGYVHLFYIKTEQYIIYWTIVCANLMSWWGKFHWNARHDCPIFQCKLPQHNIWCWCCLNGQDTVVLEWEWDCRRGWLKKTGPTAKWRGTGDRPDRLDTD